MTASLHQHDLSAALLGFGTARADLPAIAAMRKKLPAWAPPDTPGHFLKYSDQQTVLAVAAVDRVIDSAGLDPQQFQNWSIIAAPRFIGRIAGVETLERFGRGGGPAISPHVIPQHSLHSISGALSILLSSRQPNFGVGGTGNSVAEGLFAALTFPLAPTAGVLVVTTAWDPEPQLDDQANCLNTPVCHAVALALQAGAAGDNAGQLRFTMNSRAYDSDHPMSRCESAAQLCQRLNALVPGESPELFHWQMAGCGTLTLEARAMAAGLVEAA
jgi:hypothetical protein